MKQTIFTLLLLTTIGLVSCRKTGTDPDIKQYDEEQIKSYISSQGITGMQRDTSGIYYKILTAGTGSALQYTDSVGFIYTIHTTDGKYASEDTISNHFENLLGHISTSGHPLALQTAIYSLLKNKGTSMRLLVPSHLAYGINGAGSGSSTTTNSRINGNQSLDYYIHVMNDKPNDNQNTYDDQVIKNYIAAKGYTTYQRDPSGLYYSVSTPGTGSVPITDNSTVTATFTVQLLNGYIYTQNNDAGGLAIDVPDLISGMRQGLKDHATAGSKITFLIPSYLAYGRGSVTDLSVPANSVIRYDIQVLGVSP